MALISKCMFCVLLLLIRVCKPDRVLLKIHLVSHLLGCFSQAQQSHVLAFSLVRLLQSVSGVCPSDSKEPESQVCTYLAGLTIKDVPGIYNILTLQCNDVYE